MQKLTSILKVKPEEGRLVLLVCLLFLCIQAGQGLGDNAASALFFLRFGVDFLPYMYLLLGLTTFVVTMGYTAGLGRFKRSRFFEALLLGTMLLLLIERLALARPFPLLYPILWLTVSCIGMMLGTFVWNLAGEVSDARQAKRLFPLYTSAGILGSVAGNFITGTVAKRLGTDNLLILFAGLLGLAFLLTRRIAADYFQPAKQGSTSASFWSDLRSGYDFVRRSTLMKLIAYASVLFSILFFAIAFPFNKVVTASFPDEAGVAGYLGLFSGITTAITFLVSLLLANRAYARLGIVNSVLLMPLTYLFGFIVFASQYTLTGAVMARFAQLVILSGVAGTAWNALFNVVPSQKRGQVLAFENGVPSQVGVALSGALLILGERVLTTTQIFFMGIVLTAACGYMVWRMRTAYGEALVDALRAGRLEVFTGSESGFTGLQGDGAALQVLTTALKESKPTTRRLSAEILGKLGNPAATGSLIEACSDAEAAVRTAALAALGSMAGKGKVSGPHAAAVRGAVSAALSDRDADVRLQALRAFAEFPPDGAEEIRSKIETLLRDPSVEVRMEAVLALARTGETDRARNNLRDALAERDSRVRVAALETFARAAEYFNGTAEIAPVTMLLADTLSNVRVAACHALAAIHDDGAIQTLVTRLHDADLAVRQAAARSLRSVGPQANDFILNVLDSEYEAARDAGLDGLTPGSIQTSERLRQYARKEMLRLKRIRGQEVSLPAGGRATVMLCEVLRHKSRQGEGRLVKIVGLIGNEQAMQLVQKSLRGSDNEARAAALEALETLGDKVLAREVIRLLEDEPEQSTAEAALLELLQSDDRWERALAIRATQELERIDLAPQLESLMHDRDPLIAETAAEALVRLDEVRPMDTLQTVSTLERVLLLREVPIFSDLSPEDLQQVAAIAHEQWFPKDTMIFRQDEPGDMMFVIVDGHVHVVRTSNGNEQILAQRGPGDFVGEMAIIESAPRSASLLARGDVRVLAIDGETFKGILRERPEVSLAVMKSISRRLREMAG